MDRLSSWLQATKSIKLILLQQLYVTLFNDEANVSKMTLMNPGVIPSKLIVSSCNKLNNYNITIHYHVLNGKHILDIFTLGQAFKCS